MDTIAYEWITYGDIDVAFAGDLDGGGMSYGQQFIPTVSERIGHVDRVFEWCAGPGFIGFSLLASGLCDTLCLADKNPAAVAAARATVEANRLGDSVSVYESDCLESIPTDESWDLVVGNPPHAGTSKPSPAIPRRPVIYTDQGWDIHRRFYRQVPSFLRPGASVLVIENRTYSQPKDFEPMITDAGLGLFDTFDAIATFYFIWSRAREQ